jgi:fatty acid desaturase
MPVHAALHLAVAIRLATGRRAPDGDRRAGRQLGAARHRGALLLHSGRADVLAFGVLLPMLLLGLVFNPLSRGYEHYPMARLHRDDPRRRQLRHNTQTSADPMLGFLWANIAFHVEHHLHPRVPFYRLRAVHRLLAQGAGGGGAR